MNRPNIVLIHCHDLGRHLGCYGVPTVASPHLDALASQGIRATGMFAAAPQCSPSRAALFTGRWPHENGVLGLTHRQFAWDLHPGERHLAAHLGDAGYRTALIGVQHESRVLPDDQVAAKLGFDHVQTRGLAEVVADRAVARLRDEAEQSDPFYLQVGFVEPHRLPGADDRPGVMGFLGNHLQPDSTLGVTVPPYLVDDASARTELAELQGAIRHMDAAVGRILAELDRTGLAENTITIFTTDHGLALPRAKCSLYDPGLEIAFLVRWPGGGWTGGRQLDGLLSNVDVVPTLLDATGIDPAQASLPLHGRSFRPQLDGAEHAAGRQELCAEMTYHDYYDPRRCIRTDRWKLIANFSTAPGFMDPSQSWVHRCTPREPSYPHNGYHPHLELYDLSADPLEQHDLARDEAFQPVRADLVDRLAGWMRDTRDPILDGAVTSPQHAATMAALRTPAPVEQAEVPVSG